MRKTNFQQNGRRNNIISNKNSREEHGRHKSGNSNGNGSRANKRRYPESNTGLSDLNSEECLPSVVSHKQAKVFITEGMLQQMLSKAAEIIGYSNINSLSESKQQDLLNYQAEYYKLQQEHQQQLKQFAIDVAANKPLTDDELTILAYDYKAKKSVYRAFHIIDVLIARNNHQIKCDKVPIFILAGEGSCDKSKIAQYVANAVGKYLRPIVNYKVTDILGLSNGARSGSNVMVLDDFNFLGRTRDEPSIMFNQLKSWASGLPIEIRTAQTSKTA